jgi:DNA modification methylase
VIERWWPETIKREPVYADDAVVLFYCDAREIMLAMPDRSVDHTITDPPYEDASHTYGKLRDSKGRIALSNLSFVKMEETLGRDFTSKHLIRATREWLQTFCETEAVGEWKKAHEKWGAGWSRAQWWEKPDGAPQITGHKPGVPGESIATSWCSPGTMSTWNGGGLRGFYSVPVRESEPRIHETQKPVALYVKLLELFTRRGQIIFDPFAGSATMGKACKLKGRRCILVERGPHKTQEENDAFITKVINRLRMTNEQPTLFSEAALIAPSSEPVARPKTAAIIVDGVDLTKKARKPRAMPATLKA